MIETKFSITSDGNKESEWDTPRVSETEQQPARLALRLHVVRNFKAYILFFSKILSILYNVARFSR